MLQRHNRRTFLREIGGGMMLARLSAGFQGVPTGRDHLGWKPHFLKQGDGRGGWILRPAEIRFLHRSSGEYVMPFGITKMDNGEIILVASWNDGSGRPHALSERPVVTFSRDGGQTWTEFETIEGAVGRPVMLTYLGKGNLLFQSDLLWGLESGIPENNVTKRPIVQYFSNDHGRTWPERKPLQMPSNGGGLFGYKGFFGGEGNPLVERDAQGVATKVAVVGFNYPPGDNIPDVDPAIGMVRWSSDGGRTWSKEITPKEWSWEDSYNGRAYKRGTNEGSLVRATNGWLVAALRTDLPARFLPGNGVVQSRTDSLEGIVVSISKDDGVSWSSMQRVYDAGRMHAHLLRLSNGDIVMTHVVRQDIQDGRLATYRRGCGAIISRDNGLSWDKAHHYLLDDFEFSDGKSYSSAVGHLSSALLDDGHILTCYGNYPAKAACLIRWKPEHV
jgi:hypothetical protein